VKTQHLTGRYREINLT